MKRRPRLATLVGLALITGAFVTLVAINLTSALVYYVTPTELASARPSSTVRLYGIVVNRSVKWDEASQTLAFQITDGTTTVDVTSRRLPTALFRDGVGVVLVGQVAGNGHFVADELLVKHSEVYKPLGPGETLPPNVLDELRAPEPSP